VSVASILLGLAVIRPPINGFVATAIIEYGEDNAKEGIAAALDQLGAARLAVQPVEGAQGKYSISMIGRGREETLAVLNEASAHLVDAAGTVRMIPDRTAIELASDRLTEAEETERQTRSDYERWRQIRDQVEQESKSRAGSAQRRPASPTAAPQPRTTAPKVNPQWAELVQQLEKLQIERAQLLSSRTEAHPTVIDLEIRMREVEQKIASTVQFLPPGAPGDPPPEDNLPNVVDDPLPEDSEPAADSLPDLAVGERLKAAWEQALAELAQAGEAHRLALEKRIPGPRVEAQIIRPAEITGVSGGDLRLGWVVAIALASLGFGLALARMGLVSAQASLFATIDEITQTLKIPVIASLATGDGPKIPQRSHHRVRTAKVLSRAAAILAVAFIGMFTYAAAIDPLVLHIAKSSPVQAYAFAIAQVWPL
jgi:hypothetical protein